VNIRRTILEDLLEGKIYIGSSKRIALSKNLQRKEGGNSGDGWTGGRGPRQDGSISGASTSPSIPLLRRAFLKKGGVRAIRSPDEWRAITFEEKEGGAQTTHRKGKGESQKREYTHQRNI